MDQSGRRYKLKRQKKSNQTRGAGSFDHCFFFNSVTVHRARHSHTHIQKSAHRSIVVRTLTHSPTLKPKAKFHQEETNVSSQ